MQYAGFQHASCTESKESTACGLVGCCAASTSAAPSPPSAMAREARPISASCMVGEDVAGTTAAPNPCTVIGRARLNTPMYMAGVYKVNIMAVPEQPKMMEREAKQSSENSTVAGHGAGTTAAPSLRTAIAREQGQIMQKEK